MKPQLSKMMEVSMKPIFSILLQAALLLGLSSAEATADSST